LWHSGSQWHEITLQVIPNLLGFSIGAFAILVSTFQGKVGEILLGREEGQKYSDAEIISATFFHFIIVQTSAILFALFAKSGLGRDAHNMMNNFGLNAYINYLYWASLVFRFFGFLAFIYSILLVIASSAVIFRSVRWHGFASPHQNSSPDSRIQKKTKN
jgi:hypothetical protein